MSDNEKSKEQILIEAHEARVLVPFLKFLLSMLVAFMVAPIPIIGSLISVGILIYWAWKLLYEVLDFCGVWSFLGIKKK